MANTKNAPAIVDRSLTPAEQLRGVLQRGEKLGDDDPQVIATNIANQLLAADSLDALFSEQQTVNSTDLVGHALKIRNAVLRKSDLENTDAYILVDAIDVDSGEVLVMNTSSPRIMAQVLRAMELGAIDPDKSKALDVRVVEVGKAKTGQNAPTGLILA